MTEQNIKPKNNQADSNLPDGFILTDKGLFSRSENKSGDKKLEWVSDPIRVVAQTRDENGDNWGKLVFFKDGDGTAKKIAIPRSMFAGDGKEVRAWLLDAGLSIATGQRTRFTDYLNSSNPKERALCVVKIGWYKNAFVLPDRVFGDNTQVHFQSERPVNFYKQSGSLDDWRDNIGKFCSQNSKLLFSVGWAFASPLLGLFGMDGGGFHLFGQSSCGKTTALRVAASVCGDNGYITTWRATDNGLEGIACAHNDTLLILDEMGQVNPYTVGDIAYMLANGEGKNRANQYGQTKQTKHWRVGILSSGEVDLSAHMLAAGKTAKAGQDIRLIGSPATWGNPPHGIFDNIHGFASGAEFSRYLCDTVQKFYGTPLITFLEKLVGDLESVKRDFKVYCDNIGWYIPTNADGQVLRAKDRFLLAGFAGELATKYGITGWQDGESTEAARVCFNEWVACRGGVESQEKTRIMEQVKLFFERNIENFIKPDSAATYPRKDIAGYEDENYYFVLPEVFTQQVIAGLNPKLATAILREAGWLIPNEKNGYSQVTKNIGGRSAKVYRFDAKLLEHGGKE
jgi:putative DNA primase/helicase